MGFRYKDGKKVLRFSIRKYHFGAASVAIASLIFFSGMSAKAENIPTQQSSDKITNHSSSSGASNGDDGDSDADDKNISDKSIKIAKGELKKLSISLTTSIKATEKEKYSGIAKELDEILDEAKLVLDKKDAKLEEVNEQIKILTETVKKFDKIVAEANKKLEEKKATDQQKAEATKKSDSPKVDGEKTKEVAEKKADKATEKDGVELAENRPAETLKNDGTTAKIQQKEGVTPKKSVESTGKEKELSTYTNGVDTDKLAEEINNISTYLSDNGANVTKVELLKSKYSKLKSKLEVAKNGVLSEEDFNAAVSDLKDARDTIAKFLADKQAGGTSENTPKLEAILNPVERRKETDKSSVTGLINEKKAKLARLQKEIEEKFGELNQINVASIEDIVKNVNTLQNSITEVLRSSQGSADELDTLASQATRLRNSLANAIQRTHSGKRDLRNGSRIARGADFRAYDDREARRKVYDAQGNSAQEDALVGYFTKEEDKRYDYEPGTFLYISHNDDRTGTFANPDLGHQPVKRLKQKVFAKVTKATDGSGYHWKIIFNEANESRQNPIYYFTIPAGQSITNITLKENGEVKKTGGVGQVFNGENDKYQTAVGSPDSGVNGTPYYENIANITNRIVGNRASIYTLDDFVKNNTERYFNRNGMSQNDIDISDKLYEKIKSATQNIFSLKPKEYNTGSTYTIEFDTKGNTTTPLYYIVGMKSYEAGGGTFQHKSYQQWNRVQERYNVKVDESKVKTTYLKGTGVGDFDTSKGFKTGGVSLEDTYHNNKKLAITEVRDYFNYKPTGREGTFEDYLKRRHNYFTHINQGGPGNLTADSTKGFHLLHIQGTVKGEKVEFQLPYRVVTQADVYEPVVSDISNPKKYAEALGNAADYIKSYKDVSSTIPRFRRPTYEDMTGGNEGTAFYKNSITYFPTTSEQIKDQSVKSTEWVGGASLATGSRVIELTIDGKKEIFTIPSDINVVPGRTISAENVAKLNKAIHETYKKIDENGHEIESEKIPTINAMTPIWVKKQIKVTYYDNENNARTNHQDDSVDYVDVLFKHIIKEVSPEKPEVLAPLDGSVSVTPKGTTDKLEVSYIPTNETNYKTLTIKKVETVWTVEGSLPPGIRVDSSTGRVSISEPTVADNTLVKGVATYLNSDDSSASATAQSPDTEAPTVMMNGVALTERAEDNKFVIFRGADFNPTFKVADNSHLISKFDIKGIPNGVWFNKQGDKDVPKTNIPDGEYRFSNTKVEDGTSFGTREATVTVSDAKGNTKNYKFQYKIVDIKLKNSPKVAKINDVIGNPHDYLVDTTDGTTEMGDANFPTGMSWQWDSQGNKDNQNTKLTQNGTIIKVAKAVFPETALDGRFQKDGYKYYTPREIKKEVTFNVADTEKPQAKLNGIRLGTTATTPIFTVFRGATFNPELKAWDNSGKIKSVTISGLPNGVSIINSNRETTGTLDSPYTQNISNGQVSSNEQLGVHEATVTVKGSDDNDVSVFKFKYRIVDFSVQNTSGTFDNTPSVSVLPGAALNKQGDPKDLDAHRYLSIVDDNTNTLRGDSYLPAGMIWKWKQSNDQEQPAEVLNRAGYYTKKVEANFASAGDSQNVNSKTRTVFAPERITRDIRLLITPETPTIEESQLYGQSDKKPTIEVKNIISSSQVNSTAIRKVQLFSTNNSSTPIAEKTVSDNTGSVTFRPTDYQSNRPSGLILNESLYAKIIVTDNGKSVESANSESRVVTENLTLHVNNDKTIIQANDDKLNDKEKIGIKIALKEANQSLNLSDEDITISDSGEIVVTKEKKRGWLQTNPKANNGQGYVTKFANIRSDYQLEGIEGLKLQGRDSDRGFAWANNVNSGSNNVNGNRSLVYYYNASEGKAFTLNDVLKTLKLKTGVRVNSVKNPSFTDTDGTIKGKAEAGLEGYSKDSENKFKKDGNYINVLDLVDKSSLRGDLTVANSSNKLLASDKSGAGSYGTTLQDVNIARANELPEFTIPKVINGEGSIHKAQLYLRPQGVQESLVKRTENKDTLTNVINVYFVPIDSEKPHVERSSSNNLGGRESQYDYLPKENRPDFTSLVKLTDNYDKDDDTDAKNNPLRNKLSMWLKTGNEKTLIVENGVEKKDVIERLYNKATSTTVYELLAKTEDNSGNKSSENSSNGTSLGFFKTHYPEVTYRKDGNKEVTTYYEIVSQPLTSAVVGTGGRLQPVKPDFYVAFNGRRPNATSITFKDGDLPDRSTTAGVTKKTIIVEFPNGSRVEKEITINTYGNEVNYPAGKTYFETEVGKNFEKQNAADYVKTSSSLVNPSRTAIAWGDGLHSGYNPVNKIQNKIGVHEENINVYYTGVIAALRGDDTYNYTHQDIKVDLAVKPQAPTIAVDAFYGKAGMKPTVTVNNLPEANQLSDGITVKVQLKDANGNVVAEKNVNHGTTSITFEETDYINNRVLNKGEHITANVAVSGTYNKTVKNEVRATNYTLNSNNSPSRLVSGTSTLADIAEGKKVVQIQKDRLSEKEKTAIKNAILEANKDNLLKGKSISDITVSDSGLVTTLDKDNNIATIQANPVDRKVTRYANIREDYDLTFTNNGRLGNRLTDLGFEWSADHKSLIYKFDATKGTEL